MKKLYVQIAALALLMVLVCVVYRLGTGNAYAAYVPYDAARLPQSADAEAAPRFAPDDASVICCGEVASNGGYLRVALQPQAPGHAEITGRWGDEQFAARPVHVGPLLTVYDERTGGFTGDGCVMFAFSAFLLAVSALLMRNYVRARGAAYYSYTTIYSIGFSLFTLLMGLLVLFNAIRHAADPAGYPMLSAYNTICGASSRFLLITSPLLLAFAAAMALSNAEMLRHERSRLQNALGILSGIAMIAGFCVAIWLDRGGAAWLRMPRNAARAAANVFATAYAYFECLLFGAVVCDVKAAHMRPEGDADYVIILGCLFRKDGTLSPLLRGRADRALELWRAQSARGGRPMTLVPSGGQGADEPMPEAEAIRRYLLENGVPDKRILPETRSVNTYQNMLYSKELIQPHNPETAVVFSTTNYHVFRSGILARRAGLRAQGVGSPTHWWFWPNAFMRECLGLIKHRLAQEIVLLAAFTAFFALLAELTSRG